MWINVRPRRRTYLFRLFSQSFELEKFAKKSFFKTRTLWKIIRLKTLIAHASFVRYYELKMTLEDVETKEEITHLPSERRSTSRSWLRSVDHLSSSSSDAVEPLSPQSTILPGGLIAKHEAVATEQLTTSSCEERQRFVIKAVRDPRNDKQLSLQV